MTDETDNLTEDERLVIEACEQAESCIQLFRTPFENDNSSPEMAIAMARRWIVGASSATQKACEEAGDDALLAAVCVNTLALRKAAEEKARCLAAYAAAICAAEAAFAAADREPGRAFHTRSARKAATTARQYAFLALIVGKA
jgi:hypothetical protein